MSHDGNADTVLTVPLLAIFDESQKIVPDLSSSLYLPSQATFAFLERTSEKTKVAWQ